MSGVELRERLLDDCDVQPGFLEQTVEQIQGSGVLCKRSFMSIWRKRSFRKRPEM